MKYDIDEAIHSRERNYNLFLKIVGENPLDQIDWIINNGLDKFNYWYRCYETGKIYSPATVRERSSLLEIEIEVMEFKGGLGDTLYRVKDKELNEWITVDGKRYSKIVRCLALGHRWENYNHLESQCKHCGKFKIFYGYAETKVYDEPIKPKEKIR
ncbi:hypothetical protein AAXE64_08105 [Priestia megaterium]